MLNSFPKRLKRVQYGIDTRREFFYASLDKVLSVLGINTALYSRNRIARLLKKYKSDNCYAIKEIRFPILPEDYEAMFFVNIFDDIFASYVYFNDSYSEEIVNLCDSFCWEGLYGLVNDKVNVTVEPGDVVIDAGSWIGDFAAYASVRGADKIYAFEPEKNNFVILNKTAVLNKNIVPVKKGLSDENKENKIFLGALGNSGGNSILAERLDSASPSEDIETITLDDFVKENNLEHVDFIKSDIEGFERNLLKGAQETLRKFAPKLALCTYHLPDDPQVMEALIKQANPNYNVVHKSKKLYASVSK